MTHMNACDTLKVIGLVVYCADGRRRAIIFSFNRTLYYIVLDTIATVKISTATAKEYIYINIT